MGWLLTNTIPLAIWTQGDKDSELPYIKQAKAQLNIDTKVVPVVAQPGARKVLALGGRPPFVCDHALVRDPKNVEGLKAALRWYITDEPDDRVTTIAKHLSILFGAEVKEVTDEVRA